MWCVACVCFRSVSESVCLARARRGQRCRSVKWWVCVLVCALFHQAPLHQQASHSTSPLLPCCPTPIPSRSPLAHRLSSPLELNATILISCSDQSHTITSEAKTLRPPPAKNVHSSYPLNRCKATLPLVAHTHNRHLPGL